MAEINKSENTINRIENNIYGLEKDTCYKNNHKNNIYLKTYNNFYNKPKIKIVKNKTPSSKLYKVKYPSLKKSLKEKNSIYNPSYSLLDNEQNYKDRLFLEVIREQKKIKEMNKELKILLNDYSLLEEQNFTNFFIIQKIKETEDMNDKKTIKKKKNNNKNKIIKINFKNDENNKIYVLKKQINLYDMTIAKNNSKLGDIQNKPKSKRYRELMNLLYNKDNEINELIETINKYNYILYEGDSKIQFYNSKMQRYNNDINKLEKKLRSNFELIYENNEEIKKYEEQKQNLRNSKIKLLNIIKNRERELEELNIEENIFDKKLEENKTLFEEKQKNQNMLINLKIKTQKIELEIYKMEKKLSILRKDNQTYNNDLSKFNKEWPHLLKKSKIPDLNQDIMREIEKEIERNKNEIKIRDEVDGNKEKNMSVIFEEMTNLNKKYINEINNFEDDKKDLIKKINNYKIVLENNIKKKETLKKEIIEIEESNKYKKDEYLKKQKEDEEKNMKEKVENEDKNSKKKKDNELREKNYKEDEEKYNREINELKERNETLKNKKEELLKLYDEKMKTVKQMSEANLKFKKILEEIEQLSAS